MYKWVFKVSRFDNTISIVNWNWCGWLKESLASQQEKATCKTESWFWTDFHNVGIIRYNVQACSQYIGEKNWPCFCPRWFRVFNYLKVFSVTQGLTEQANHTSPWVFPCKFVAYFQKNFSKNISGSGQLLLVHLNRSLTKTRRGYYRCAFFRPVVTVSDDFSLRKKTRQFILLMTDEKVNKS